MTKKDLEDEALAALATALNESGRAARLTTNPDRDPEHPLTVDAVFEIDGQAWAVEHTRLTFAQSGPAASTSAERRLRPRLESIAVKSGRSMMVGIAPHLANNDAHDAEVIAMAERAAATGQDQWGEGAFPSVQLIAGSAGASPIVELMMALTTDPSVEAQLTETMTEPIRKKADGQLRAAKGAGFPVMLLVDQVTPIDTKMPSNFTASPVTVGKVLASILSEFPATVHESWMRDRSGALHRIL